MAGGFGTADLRLRDVTDATDVGPGTQRDVGPGLLPLWSLGQTFSTGLCYGWYYEKYRKLNNFMIICTQQLLSSQCSGSKFQPEKGPEGYCPIPQVCPSTPPNISVT